jgi:hypothetical protein
MSEDAHKEEEEAKVSSLSSRDISEGGDQTTKKEDEVIFENTQHSYSGKLPTV